MIAPQTTKARELLAGLTDVQEVGLRTALDLLSDGRAWWWSDVVDGMLEAADLSLSDSRSRGLMGGLLQKLVKVMDLTKLGVKNYDVRLPGGRPRDDRRVRLAEHGRVRWFDGEAV